MKLIQSGNSKLKNQHMFNLPATKQICGRICEGCYAAREQVRFPKTVLGARTSRYEASLKDSFSDLVIAELSRIRKPFKAFRIHASGEFYSQAYLDKWTTIAKSLPHIKFYAFTKRMKDFDFSALKALPNVSIINSLQFGRLNYDKLEIIKPIAQTHAAKICPATGCGTTCSHCWTKSAQNQGVLFVKH